MLQKRYRLKSPGVFKKALRGYRLCGTPYFAVFAIPRPAHQAPSMNADALPQTRFGLVVSKKIDKRATRRNRIKRHLREAIRNELLIKCKALLHGYSAVVIVARPPILEASYQEIQTRLLQCFKS